MDTPVQTAIRCTPAERPVLTKRKRYKRGAADQGKERIWNFSDVKNNAHE